MKVYETASGQRTERITVELTLAEAEAFAESFRSLNLDEGETWPIFTGLRRIAKAVAAERDTQPERNADA